VLGTRLTKPNIGAWFGAFISKERQTSRCRTPVLMGINIGFFLAYLSIVLKKKEDCGIWLLVLCRLGMAAGYSI